LVAAFRATLEEVLEAEVIIHVRDVSHDETLAQARDVEGVLKDLGVDPERCAGDLCVLNKIDRLDHDAQLALSNQAVRHPHAIPVSAITGAGIDDLLAQIDARLSGGMVRRDLTIEPAQGALLAWIYRHGNVIARRDDDDGLVHVTVDFDEADQQRFDKLVEEYR
jgi:GTP-binding protein HflX